MKRLHVIAIAALSCLLATTSARSEPPPDAPHTDTPPPVAAQPALPSTEELLAATVTVRIIEARSVAAAPKNSAPEFGAHAHEEHPADGAGNASAPGVTVASGVSLGGGLVVTFAVSPAPARIRVTLPGGEQSEAQLQVVDEHSGLTLLQIDRTDVPGLELAEDAPAIGAAVLTAAAAGIEQPIVSLGIVGGVDRMLRGSGLPPLVQCDVRTTETSSGAAVVDAAGRLVGIVVATPADGEQGGWTYAVPARHVQRLLQARVEGSIVVLRHERPSVGLTLGAGKAEGTVRVDRVVPGGPADEAGIRPGDLVVEADGLKTRSAYQAVSLILKKQPGDKVEFVLEQQGRRRTVAITLGDAVRLAGGRPPSDSNVHIGPRLTVRAAGPGQIEVQDGPRVAELAAGADDEPGPPAAPRIPRDEVGLLKAQIEAFAKVIERLQVELAQRDEAQRHTNELLKSLTDEVTRLREELGEEDHAP